ncbi:hypothetical protein ACVFYP_15630 [Roseomonas sp. F4]
MSSDSLGPHLVSNFRESLSILENLRASARPGRGMRHLARRPVVDALRASELTAVTGGLDGEFPVLCRVGASACPVGDLQAACIPLGRITAFIFRTEDERDQVAGKMFENISTDGLPMEVAPGLFGREGPSRCGEKSTDLAAGETPDWIRADALAGAVGAVLALAHRRPEAVAAATAFLDGSGALSVDLTAFANALHSPDGPWDTPGSAVAAVMSSLRGMPGQDPMEMVDLYAEALGSSGYAADNLDRFKNFVSDVVTSRRARRPQDLADGGDVLLRALLLVLQRDRMDEILDDLADGVPPGPTVHLTAAALAGFREGLARMPSAIKQPLREILGEFASAVESDPSARAEDLTAPLKAQLPAVPTADAATSPARDTAVPSGSVDGGMPVAALVRELQSVAEALGLSHSRTEDGILGTCDRTGVGALISSLPDGATEAPRLGLRVVLGAIAGGALVREALSGALLAEPGSVLWQAPGSGDLELVFPIGEGAAQHAPLALRRNVDLARRWVAAAAPAAQAAGGDAPAESGKKARKPRGGGGRKQPGASSSAQGTDSIGLNTSAEISRKGTGTTLGEASKPARKRRVRKISAERDRTTADQASLLVPETIPGQGAERDADAGERGADPAPKNDVP